MTLLDLIIEKNAAAKDFNSDSWAKESGSQIGVIDAQEATLIAGCIQAMAGTYPLATVAILAAWIAGESLFDPRAINPNNQEAKPGESAQDIFFRTDYGLVQVDGRYMSSHNQMQGLTQEQMLEKVYDPAWAVEDLAITATKLLTWSRTLTPKACGPYLPLVVGFNAYNKGQEGTLKLIAEGEPLLYGPRLYMRMLDFEELLG
jgi:hypothetical protein